MAYGRPEQIDELIRWPQKVFARSLSTRTPGYAKMLKKIATRRMRVDGKKLLDDAPNKNQYYGWSV